MHSPPKSDHGSLPSNTYWFFRHTLECKSLAACLWGVLFVGRAFFTQESLLLPFCSSRVYAKTTNSCDMPEIKQAWILVRVPLEWVCDIELVTRWCLCSLDSQVQMWQVFSDWANIWPHQGLWEVATGGAHFSPPPPGQPFWSLSLLSGCVILSKLTKLCLLSRFCVHGHTCCTSCVSWVDKCRVLRGAPLIARACGEGSGLPPLKTEGRPCRCDWVMDPEKGEMVPNCSRAEYSSGGS